MAAATRPAQRALRQDSGTLVLVMCGAWAPLSAVVLPGLVGLARDFARPQRRQPAVAQ